MTAGTTLRNQTVTGCFGSGINVDDGGSLESPAHHIILENVTVLDTGPKGNHDSIKLSGLDDFAIRQCRVAGWGGSAIDVVVTGGSSRTARSRARRGSRRGKDELATQEERE
ncbi:MAG: hypothetical protein ACYS0K_18055 [Planctomycetota bacterium]